MPQREKVNIRPQVTMLSVLKYLEYETWYALAEFVDNSLASYLNYEKEIKKVSGNNFKLEVKIELNDTDNKIVIRDNAAGIHRKDFARAFRAAEAPLDASGLSEFGMGMKSAACWFSDDWSVRTTALGERQEKTVRFEMDKIYNEKVEDLEVREKLADINAHYTIIELNNVNKMPRKRGVGKVKEHLKSIYRDFIRRGVLILTVDNEELQYSEPKILNVPRFDPKANIYTPLGPAILWRKEIEFKIKDGLSVHGFVAIREKASTSEAGFALFRRGRVIEGSYDSGFRPDYIFGSSNSFRYQRVFGELHLEGFDVVFTKKGVKWDENLDIFLKRLREELTNDKFPLLQQAEKYRARATDPEYQSTKKALDQTVNDLKNRGKKAIEEVRNNNESVEPEERELSKTDKTIHREFDIRFNKTSWNISIELSFDPSLTELVEIGNHIIRNKTKNSSIRQIGIRLSLVHPFMIQYAGTDNSKVEPILRLVAALGLSEIIAKESGAKTQGEIRRNFNALISNLVKA